MRRKKEYSENIGSYITIRMLAACLFGFLIAASVIIVFGYIWNIPSWLVVPLLALFFIISIIGTFIALIIHRKEEEKNRRSH